MPRVIALFLVLLFVSGCSTLKYSDYERGKVWCNDRYLHKLDKPFHEKHLKVARRGYMYALAGVLVLQGNTQEDKEHYFPTPSRLEMIDKPKRDTSGFEVGTFKLYVDDDRSEVKEIIIAFTGSNDSDDWLWTNLFFSKRQYELAVEYVLKIAKEFKNYRIVVTGYSLGGGLAVHVAKNPETKNYISEVWALNPSPKTYSNNDQDDRIWMAAVEGEALAKMRWPIFRVWPGVYNIGAPESQTADEYYLIQSTNIYGHFSWVLARNILHVADLAIYNETGAERTEPLVILQGSNFESCKEFKK